MITLSKEETWSLARLLKKRIHYASLLDQLDGMDTIRLPVEGWTSFQVMTRPTQSNCGGITSTIEVHEDALSVFMPTVEEMQMRLRRVLVEIDAIIKEQWSIEIDYEA